MPKPPRRRITSADVNRELQSPAMLTLPRTQRRAAKSLLLLLEDVRGRYVSSVVYDD